MDLNLTSKRVLVTGSSRGIGLAIAEGFLKEGSKTCLVSRGSRALFENGKRLTKTYGSENVATLTCDCISIESIQSLKDKLKKQWEGLDIVVINVGDGRSVSDALPEDDQWRKTWNNNFESALQTARVFLPLLEESRGVLLFVSSIAGIEAFGAPTDYSTAKSAIISLSKNIARKLAPRVRVNVIAPGNVLFKGGSWDEKIKQNKERVDSIVNSTVPMKRFATPEEIADSAIFLCSDKASFITGTTLVVDGGQTVGAV